jgi:uncharacterized protein (DUF1697 family)
MGFQDVSTFRTSGNVVFHTGQQARSKLTSKIETYLTDALGFEVSVFLRTDSEMGTITKRKPFSPKLVKASAGKMQVALLSAKPAQRPRKQVLALATDEDRLAFGDRELYWLPSGGTRDAALDYREIEKLLGPTTRRTKGTLDDMVQKYFSH